jgi:hypothetical protein
MIGWPMLEYHPWIWLNEPQHGTAVQAVAAIVATIAAVAAGLYAGGAYRSTVRQLELAKEQLQLQKDQFDAEKQRVSEERRAERNRMLSEYTRKEAEENAERPRFRTGSFTNAKVYNMEFQNVGVTAATEVQFVPVGSDLPPRLFDVIQPGQTVVVPINMEEFRTRGIGIGVRFRTKYGSLWHVNLTMPLNAALSEDVVEVKRIYGLPDGANH